MEIKSHITTKDKLITAGLFILVIAIFIFFFIQLTLNF